MIVNQGLNAGYLLVQLISLAIVVAWIVLLVMCLVRLRATNLSSTTKAIWVLILAAIPVLGAVAYLIVKPTE
jgi:uncharacterized membrane protein YhaH (DUF805 family)